MPQAFRNTLLTLRDLIVSAGPQLHRGYPCLSKQLAAMATGVEVATVAGDRLYGPQIDDAAHPGGAGDGDPS